MQVILSSHNISGNSLPLSGESAVFYSNAASIIGKNITLERDEKFTVPVDEFQLDGFRCKKFVAVVECADSEHYIATFKDAEISYSGDSVTEALQELKIEIVEQYKLLISENNLGPFMNRQLQILEKFLG